MYVCKCGREFEKSQSYVAHCGHCKVHLGREPDDRFGESRRSNLGKHLPNKSKIPLEDILANKVRGYLPVRLKWRLINEGYKEYKCEKCGLTEWLGGDLPIELHHINGDKEDNNLSNLQILCPNCHSLTDNYRWKKSRNRDSRV